MIWATHAVAQIRKEPPTESGSSGSHERLAVAGEPIQRHYGETVNMKWVCRWMLASLGLLFVGSAHAATVTSTNFIVHARQQAVAEQVARYAEYYRKSKAIEWLGQEIPDWNSPCEVEVKITFGGAGGATSFSFEGGQVLGQSMVVEGSLERILHSVLPHEITHTIFAAKFRRPLPRWADEGGAVLSEDHEEIARHDLLVRKIINRGNMIPLSRLFILTEYPRDVMALYAQGFSVARYLVSLRGRQKFLEFVDHGQQIGWDYAVHHDYGFASVDALEYQWIQWLRAGRGTGADGGTLLADSGAPNVQQPVFRGQIPEEREQQQPAYVAASDGRPWQQSAGPQQQASPVVRTSREGTASAPNTEPIPVIDTPKPLPAEMTAARTPSTDTNTESAPPRAVLQPRLIPIAVGRTRRSHGRPAIPPAPSRVVEK